MSSGSAAGRRRPCMKNFAKLPRKHTKALDRRGNACIPRIVARTFPAGRSRRECRKKRSNRRCAVPRSQWRQEHWLPCSSRLVSLCCLAGESLNRFPGWRGLRAHYRLERPLRPSLPMLSWKLARSLEPFGRPENNWRRGNQRSVPARSVSGMSPI